MTGCAFVAVRDGHVVGFIRVISDGEVVSYVTEVAVDAGARFQGIGRALIDAVAAEFPKARIDLLSTSSAQEFYDTLCFTRKSGYRRWPQ
jgi:ribosomal protein S18 acetylase RimI-like enzyme